MICSKIQSCNITAYRRGNVRSAIVETLKWHSGGLKHLLSTSSLIQPSYPLRATIFEKVFWPEKFPKTEYFPTRRIISLSSRISKFSSKTCKLYFPPWIHFIKQAHAKFLILCSVYPPSLDILWSHCIPPTSGVQAGKNI